MALNKLSQLNPLAVLTNIKLDMNPAYTTNIFQYLTGAFNAIMRDRLAYAVFDSNSYYRRRNPADNTTLHNIDVPRFGLTPDLKYRMTGSKVHIDASIGFESKAFPKIGTAALTPWSGLWIGVGSLSVTASYQMRFMTYLEYGVKPGPLYDEFIW